MSKWFEVEVVTVKVFAVEVPDDETEEQAYTYVESKVPDFQEMEAREVTGEKNISRLRRYADHVLSL